MEKDNHSLIKVVDVINVEDGQAAGAATVGAIINVGANERFESLEFILSSGVITTGSFTVTLEESDVVTFGGEETAIAADDILGGSPTFAVTDDNVIVRFGVISKKDFVRLTLVGASTPVGDFSCVAVLGHSKSAPVAAQTI